MTTHSPMNPEYLNLTDTGIDARERLGLAAALALLSGLELLSGLDLAGGRGPGL